MEQVLKNMVKEAIKRGKAWTVGEQLKGAVDIVSILPEVKQRVIDFTPGWDYNSAVRRYFLNKEVCYVELPKTLKSNSVNLQMMEKYLATSNVGVVANWLGVSEEEAHKGYGKRLERADNEEEGVSYVKLYTGKNDEKKVTRPRKNLNLMQSGLRVVPLSLLEVACETLIPMLEDDIYTLEYYKNSGVKRTQVTTLNRKELIKLYKDEGYVDGVLSSCTDSKLDGGYFLPDRGYMTIPEIGASIYDEGVRRVTLARLVSIEKGGTVDTTYLHVDLKSVVDEFIQCLWINTDLSGEAVFKELESFGFEVKGDRTLGSLEGWVQAEVKSKGTPFLREIHDWMIIHKTWFPQYTGKRVYKKSEDSYGII